MSIREKIEKGAVHAIFVIEIAGRPPEHIEKAIHTIADAFGKQKGLEIIMKKFHKPEPVEKLYSCFAEIEFLADNFSRLLNLIFYFMPSSVEIIEPKIIKLKISDASNIANDLSTRLHQYDSMAKKLQIEKAIILKQVQEKLKLKDNSKKEKRKEKIKKKNNKKIK
jgi:hypothetical protein